MAYKVAIIDQGIDVGHERLKDCRIEGVSISIDDGGVHYSHNDVSDLTGHGTAIAAIIYKLVPDCTLVCIKLDTDQLSTALICEGIKVCLEDPEIRVINISMGIVADVAPDQLVDSCRRAWEKGVWIIASAYKNERTTCYPAFLPFVISVGVGLVRQKSDYKWIGAGEGVNVLAKGTVQRIAWKNNTYRIASGSSYAAAHFSARLMLLLLQTKNISLDLIEEHSSSEVQGLQQVNIGKQEDRVVGVDISDSEEGKRLFSSEAKISFARNIGIFPASDKELNTITEFREYLCGELAVAIDFPRSMTKRNHTVPVVTNIDDIDFDKIDTLVVGFFLEQSLEVNLYFGHSLIKECISRKKNFITWDRNVYYYIKQNVGEGYEGKVFYICVNDRLRRNVARYRYFPSVRVPVVAVIGTSSRQGKITSQMVVRKVMHESGYRVAHIATEPQAILLGADFVFPYGGVKNSDVYLPQQEWPDFLGVVCRGVQEYKKPHIIITGCQGFTIPPVLSPTNVSAGVLASLQFLASMQPDGLVVTVDHSDSLDFIHKVVSTVEIFCNSAKNIFIVLHPITRTVSQTTSGVIRTERPLTESEFIARSAQLEKEFNVPVLNILNSEHQSKIPELIQSRYS